MRVPTARKSNIHLTICPNILREQNVRFLGRLSLGSVDCQCKRNLQGKLKSGELKWEVFPSIMTWYPRKNQNLVFIITLDIKLVQDHSVLSKHFDQISCFIAMASINVHILQQNYLSVNFQFECVLSNCINGMQISWDPFHHFIIDLINNFVCSSKENSSLEVLSIINVRFESSNTFCITSSLDGWHILEGISVKVVKNW